MLLRQNFAKIHVVAIPSFLFCSVIIFNSSVERLLYALPSYVSFIFAKKILSNINDNIIMQMFYILKLELQMVSRILTSVIF